MKVFPFLQAFSIVYYTPRHRVCKRKPEALYAFIFVAQMPQPGVGVEGVACLPSAVGRLCLRLVQYLQCQRETETERGARTAELSAQVICMGGQACR